MNFSFFEDSSLVILQGACIIIITRPSQVLSLLTNSNGDSNSPSWPVLVSPGGMQMCRLEGADGPGSRWSLYFISGAETSHVTWVCRKSCGSFVEQVKREGLFKCHTGLRFGSRARARRLFSLPQFPPSSPPPLFLAEGVPVLHSLPRTSEVQRFCL